MRKRPVGEANSSAENKVKEVQEYNENVCA